MSNSSITEEFSLEAVTTGFESNETLNVEIELWDKDEKKLKKKKDTVSIDSKGIADYTFKIEDITSDTKIIDNVKYITGWIDADGDGLVDINYDAFEMFTIGEAELFELFLSYDEYDLPLKPQVHEVESAETLSGISDLYKGISYAQIASFNKIDNPNMIYPGQSLIIPREIKIIEEKKSFTKLNGNNLILGSKIYISASGTPNAKATIEVLADDEPFEIIKEGTGVTSFEVEFDENGLSQTAVELRALDNSKYKSLINDLSPKVGHRIFAKNITLKSSIKRGNSYTELITNDYNTLSLNVAQLAIKSATIINPYTKEVEKVLKVEIDGNNVVFIDPDTNEPVAKGSLDDVVASLGNVNNAVAGIAKGMDNIEGTFAVRNSKGINFKHYENSWAGDQYVKTNSFSKWGASIGRGTSLLSILIGGYQINSAHDKDQVLYRKESFIDNIGENTEQQIGSTTFGIVAGGLVTGVITVAILPASAGVFLTLGTYLVVGAAAGWVTSYVGQEVVEEIQDYKGSTIIHNYPLLEIKE